MEPSEMRRGRAAAQLFPEDPNAGVAACSHGPSSYALVSRPYRDSSTNACSITWRSKKQPSLAFRDGDGQRRRGGGLAGDKISGTPNVFLIPCFFLFFAHVNIFFSVTNFRCCYCFSRCLVLLLLYLISLVFLILLAISCKTCVGVPLILSLARRCTRFEGS
jgi:hypothetical protein